MKKLAVIACGAALACAFVVAPVEGQEPEYISIYTPVPGPGSPEHVKKRGAVDQLRGCVADGECESRH